MKIVQIDPRTELREDGAWRLTSPSGFVGQWRYAKRPKHQPRNPGPMAKDLMADAFLPKRPIGGVVGFVDGNPCNLAASNLMWVQWGIEHKRKKAVLRAIEGI